MGMQLSPESQIELDKKVEIEIAKLSESPEKILKELHRVAFDQSLDARFHFSSPISRFATLLVVLGKQADEMTKKNLVMQEKVVKLTWALFFLTLILMFIGAIQLYIMTKQHTP